MSDFLPGPTLPKKPKRLRHYNPSWIQQFPGIGTSSKGMYVCHSSRDNTLHVNIMTGNVYARCTHSALDFSISNGGLSNVKTHFTWKASPRVGHSLLFKISENFFFQPQAPHGVILKQKLCGHGLWLNIISLSRPVTMPPNSSVTCFQIPT